MLVHVESEQITLNPLTLAVAVDNTNGFGAPDIGGVSVRL
jgi:hypothetical protein